MTLSTEQQSKNENAQQILDTERPASDDIGWMFDGLSELEQQTIQRKIDWVLRVRDVRESGTKASSKEMIQAAATDLGCHPRTIKRMLDAVDTDGIIALTRGSRADKGKVRYISEPWRKLVVELYKRGTRCSRRTNRHQIWLLIKALLPKVEAAVTKTCNDLDAQFAWIQPN